MDIKTDNSAVIATLNKRIENLERYNSGLANESCEQQIKIAELDNANQSLGYECAALNRKVAELEKDNDWLFDFALGYTNIEFINESLKALKEQG
jgi:FtsZ-binding cell division protein ZapB